MTKPREVGSINFDDILKNNNIVVLDFWAPWCGPCKAFGPIFERVSVKHPDILFGKINTEDEQLLSSVLEIRSIPTIMVFRENVIVFKQSGLLPEVALDDLIKQVKALDMDLVRSQIALEAQSQAVQK